jgi:hypothetical protein
MKFFVSRQKYWGVEPEEGTIVEISIGGIDFANPDMLGFLWPNLGEGKEFTDPREAVEAAIAICDVWKLREPNAKVACGWTAGNTLPFDSETYDVLREFAEKTYDKLPKCEECGCLLGKRTYTHELCMDNEKFCREYCADENYRKHIELNE